MAFLFLKKQEKLEYCFAREKEIVFAQQKQSVPMSVPMSINVEMTIFLRLICFSIYDKMQGFIDESGLFIFLFIYLFFFASEINAFLCLTQKFKMATKSGRENSFFVKIMPVDSADTLWVINFVEIALSRSIFEINALKHFMQKFKMAAKRCGKMIFEESCQKTLQIPCGSRILSKLPFLAPFPR